MSKEVVVYTTAGELNADMVVEFLKSNGINSFASTEAIGSVYGVPNSFMGRARIYVLEEDEERARELLTAMDEGELILPENVDLTEAFEGGIEPVDDAELAEEDDNEV
ncbi:MAG: DUF2007 domain-containing protein [Anaerolineae bacterium]|nr:DUF2007 domain-containing protein [Anaerolineae bacterium]